MSKIGSFASGVTEVFKCFKTGIDVVDKVIPAVCWFLIMWVFFMLMIPLAWDVTVTFLVNIFTSPPVEFVGEGISNTTGQVMNGLGSASDSVVETVSGWMPGDDEAAVIDGTTGAEVPVESLPSIE